LGSSMQNKSGELIPIADVLFCEGWRTPCTYVSKHYASLPQSSGVYIFLSSPIAELTSRDDRQRRVFYVGMARRLARRFQNHHVLVLLDDYHTQIWFRSVPVAMLRQTERELIHKYNPPYNIIGRRRGE
jgi:excinuclease UvrABC nuclease subunit